MWYIDNIKKLFFPEKHLLPRADFVLTNGKETIQVTGWLPCHHTNIAYNLDIKNNRILRVIDMKVDRAKNKRPKLSHKPPEIKSQKTFAKDSYLKSTKTLLWTHIHQQLYGLGRPVFSL